MNEPTAPKGGNFGFASTFLELPRAFFHVLRFHVSDEDRNTSAPSLRSLSRAFSSSERVSSIKAYPVSQPRQLTGLR